MEFPLPQVFHKSEGARRRICVIVRLRRKWESATSMNLHDVKARCFVGQRDLNLAVLQRVIAVSDKVVREKRYVRDTDFLAVLSWGVSCNAWDRPMGGEFAAKVERRVLRNEKETNGRRD